MQGKSCILTTHTMLEAESLCRRIGIMVNGQLRCLGSAQHLRSRFGQGYQIDINFDIGYDGGDGNDDISDCGSVVELAFNLEQAIDQCTNKFEIWLGSQFKHWERLEAQNSHFKYKVDKSLSIGMIFNEIESNKYRLSIKEYSVSQTSLEQIFLYFARNQLQNDSSTGDTAIDQEKEKRKGKGIKNDNSQSTFQRVGLGHGNGSNKNDYRLL